MTSPLAIGRAVGILFLVSYLGVFISSALIGSALDADTPRAALAAAEGDLTIGAIAELINGIAVIGIAALLFPLFRRAGEGLALWYFGIRVAAAALFLLRSVALLALAAFAAASLETTGSHAQFEAGRSLLLGVHDGAEILGNAGFVAGSVLFYILLYRSQIVPTFIAIWGLVATVLLAVVYVGAPDVVNNPSPLAILVLPMVANELFLAAWLLAKGARDPDAVRQPEANTAH